MKLDVRSFRQLAPEDWRVLTAFEMGSKNHSLVPTKLAIQLSGLHTGANGVQKSISTLARAGLIAKVKNAKYDGYRLTAGGYDYLALHAHVSSSSILHLGSPMGAGKESDILLVSTPSPSQPPSDPEPVQAILKIHRLGRTSFRSVATNRSYHGPRAHASWQYLSRLSAQREFSAMKALYSAGFPVPRPVAANRHAVVMGLVPGTPLRDVPLSAFGGDEQSVADLYDGIMELALRLASRGLIHGDLNEFNILIENVPGEPSNPAMSNTDGQPLRMIPHLIDFPQITSLSHPSASSLFARDIQGVKSFFRKRYHHEPLDEGPSFADALAALQGSKENGKERLDVDIEAAGFSRKDRSEGSRALEEEFEASRAAEDEAEKAGGEGRGEDDDGAQAAHVDQDGNKAKAKAKHTDEDDRLNSTRDIAHATPPEDAGNSSSGSSNDNPTITISSHAASQAQAQPDGVTTSLTASNLERLTLQSGDGDDDGATTTTTTTTDERTVEDVVASIPFVPTEATTAAATRKKTKKRRGDMDRPAMKVKATAGWAI